MSQVSAVIHAAAFLLNYTSVIINVHFSRKLGFLVKPAWWTMLYIYN